MGNFHCVPRLQGENLKNYVQRNLCPQRRKRKIDNLVKLAACGDGQNFKKEADKIILTKKELDHYYEERNAVVDNEFEDDVIEVEIYDYGHESPSDYGDTDSDEYETDISECSSYRQEFTPVTPKFANPRMQQMYEEYCRKEWAKRLDMISLSDLPELDEYKDNKKSYVAQNGHIETMAPFKSCQDIQSGTVEANLVDQRDLTRRNTKRECIRKNIDGKPDKGSHEDPETPGGTSEVFVNVEEIGNSDQDMIHILNEKNKIRILERISRGLKVSNKVNRTAERAYLEQSKSEKKQDDNAIKQKNQQHKLKHERVAVETINHIATETNGVLARVLPVKTDAVGHMFNKHGTSEDTRGRLSSIVKRYWRFDGFSKSDSNVIHVKPASPETCFDNCTRE